MCDAIVDAVCIACKYSRFEILKFVLTLIKDNYNNKKQLNFNINDTIHVLDPDYTGCYDDGMYTPLMLCVKSVNLDNIHEDQFENKNLNCFKLLLSQADIIVNDDLFIHCILSSKVKLLEYLIDNNGKYPSWKLDFKRKFDLSQFKNKTISKPVLNQLADVKFSSCIAIAFFSIGCGSYEPNLDVLDILFDKEIFSIEEMIDMCEELFTIMLKTAEPQGPTPIGYHRGPMYASFCYLIRRGYTYGYGGDDVNNRDNRDSKENDDGSINGDKINGQTRQNSLFTPSREIIKLLQQQNRVGCLKWLVDLDEVKQQSVTNVDEKLDILGGMSKSQIVEILAQKQKEYEEYARINNNENDELNANSNTSEEQEYPFFELDV